MPSYHTLFNRIADDLVEQSYSIQSQCAPTDMCDALLKQALENNNTFVSASVGRALNKTQDNRIRSDKTKWITGQTQAEHLWLDWCDQLREHFNQHLYLGLKSVECHFSIYTPGDCYKKHVDAFKGKSNRKISMVLYLNKDWQPEHEGQLMIYPPNQSALKVDPIFSSFIVFLSEDIPHEVLASRRDRYAIACWFRID